MTNGNMELAKDWYDRGKEDGIKEFADWLVKYKVIPDGVMQEYIRDFKGEMKNDRN